MRVKKWVHAGLRCTAVASASLEQGDARLLAGLDRDFAAVAALAGAELVCAPGCSECCHGPFPVTRLDVWRLRRGLRELERREPSRAARLRERARRAVEILNDGYPGDRQSGKLVADGAALDAFFERHGALPCPALDPSTDRCELYTWRPVACRTYGPPLRFGDEAAPPCRLCFRQAGPALTERCRMEPDEAGREESLLRRLGVEPGAEWETLIAFVVARRVLR